MDQRIKLMLEIEWLDKAEKYITNTILGQKICE